MPAPARSPVARSAVARAKVTRSTARPLVRTVAGPLALLLALSLSGCGDDADPEPSGAAPVLASPSLPSVASGVTQKGVPLLVNIVFQDGVLTPAVSTIPLARNTRVRLTVLADTADELLVTGYGLRAQLTVGVPEQLTFVADRSGTFEVVLKDAGTVLTRLAVR